MEGTPRRRRGIVSPTEGILYIFKTVIDPTGILNDTFDTENSHLPLPLTHVTILYPVLDPVRLVWSCTSLG